MRVHVFRDKCLRTQLIRSHGKHMFNFIRNCHTKEKMTIPFSTHTNTVYKSSNFSTIFQALSITVSMFQF